LNKLSDNELKQHYLTYGKNEGRIYKYNLPDNFDLNSYKELNSDLTNLSDNELKQHYLKYGKNEGRIYKYNLPDNFDLNSYRELNSDLTNLSDNELKQHYLTYGGKEGRIYKYKLPEDFDINSYRELNSDLTNLSDNELEKHYLKYGKNEERIYKYKLPEDFDLNSYRELNSDLINLSDTELKKHYLTRAEKEERNYKLPEDSDLIKKIIKNHYNISYNSKKIDDLSSDIFENINLYFNRNINKYKFLNNITFFDYNINYSIYKTKNIYLYNKDENQIYNKLNNIINLIKDAYKEGKENMLIIFNENISFNYLQYYKSIKDILEDNYYDIIELSSINNDLDFYKLIKKELKIFNIDYIYKHFFDCIYIKKSGLKKIYDNNNDNNNIINNCKLGFYSRPLFNYNIEEYDLENKELYIYYLSNILWDSYYRVTKYWDKIYCINLGFDIEKRNNMITYCNLLNLKEKDFFYTGILGLNLPDINTLINMNIYDSNIINKFNIKTGTIGLNITQKNIIKETIDNNYNYTLILEDDIYFNENYFKVLDLIFHKYKNIDILYLGCVIHNHEKKDIFDKIDVIYDYSIYKPKKNLLEKICIGGFYSVLLSNKALKIYYDRFNPIGNISDVLLCDIVFDIKNDFSNNTFFKTNYNLNTIFIDTLVNVDTNKQSLTESNDFNIVSNLINNKSLKYLSKIKKINFKMSTNYSIKIYISEYIKLYYKKIVDIINNIIINIKIIDYYDENTEIVLYTCHDNLNLSDNNINICVNGENKDCQELTDIAILTIKKNDYKYNIYFPQLFSSLWERKDNYFIIKNNSKELFCAYMYSYDVKYRVEIYNFISTYKKVDALGKSCNNDDFQDDRSTYNDIETYNDVAIKKYSKYKFVLALENSIYNGYITEKLINPILAKSIPIYAGPKDAFEIINKKRVIYVYDFSNYNDLLEYIIKVDNDNDLYNSIILEEIFNYNSNLNFENFENYLLDNLKKAFGLIPKEIYLSNTIIDNNFIDNNFINFELKNLEIPFYNDKLIHRYLTDYINKDDKLIIKNILSKIKFYLINLDHRTDRYENAMNEFNKIKLNNIERFSAIKPSKEDILKYNFINVNKLWKNDENYIIGSAGCKISHYEVLIKALNDDKNYEYICILEDDIEFENNAAEYLSKSLLYIEENKINFDILFLTSNLGKKEDANKVNDNLLKLIKGLTTTGQIFKYSNLGNIIDIIKSSDAEIDNTYQDYLQNKYCVYPMCAYQKKFYSDILESDIDYGNFHKKFFY
jgi:GR25 family glycosyltransferase involved in LPS biosynthesis